MSLQIVLHPSAIAEVQQARTYYAELDEELGEDFENELNVVLLRAQKLPSHGRAWRKV